MKLIYCPKCCDIVLLQYYQRSCACMASWGRYLDKKIASIGGEAIPIGIDNRSFIAALFSRPCVPGPGSRFDAFVIPIVSPTIVKEEAYDKYDSDSDSPNHNPE